MSDVKLCECGCGQPTRIASQTRRKWGHVKGQPVRFLPGHYARVQKQPEGFHAKPGPPLSERFWERVDRRGPDDCWEWTAGRTRAGYGLLTEGPRGNRRYVLAHRLSYELANGPIPDGRHVCHRCDNPPCVNPAHLWLGSHADNMADMKTKGRVRKPAA